MDEMIGIFLEEASDILDKLRSLLSESNAEFLSDDEVKEFSRLLHNLKGSSASVGLNHYSKLIHHIEDLIAPFKEVSARTRLKKDYTLLITDRMEDCGRNLLSGVAEEALIQESLNWLGSTFTTTATGEPQIALESPAETHELKDAKKPIAKEDASLRIPESVLDNIFQLVEELAQIKNSYQYQHRVPTPPMDSLQDTDDRFEIILRKLNRNVLASRLVSFEKVAQRMQRIVDQYLKSSEKKITLELTQVTTEMDKAVVDGIPELLIHLIKNALDHGIEPPKDRAANGKPEEAKIELICSKDADSYRITVRDDGRGIDPARVGRVALEKGVITTDQLSAMEESEIQELIFKPGFSTAEKITDVSGRGVGMDAVLAGIHRLGGRLELQSEVGNGTRISLIFPSSLRFIDVFVVTCGEHLVLLPLKEVLCVQPLTAEQLAIHQAGESFLDLEDGIVEVVDLREWLGFPRSVPAEVLVLLRYGDRRIGVMTDRVQTRTSCVIKPLHKSFESHPWYQGGVILGNGEVSMVLDLHALIRHYLRPGFQESPHAA